jgi:GAF domain-containing protein
MSCSVFKGKVKNLPYAIKMTMNLEYPLVTNLANFSKLIFDYFDNTSWAGFYLTGLDNNLYLGPFQGDTATPFIEYGKGVCGSSSKDKEVKLVPNVHDFPGHIACSELSNSEIVGNQPHQKYFSYISSRGLVGVSKFLDLINLMLTRL